VRAHANRPAGVDRSQRAHSDSSLCVGHTPMPHCSRVRPLEAQESKVQHALLVRDPVFKYRGGWDDNHAGFVSNVLVLFVEYSVEHGSTLNVSTTAESRQPPTTSCAFVVANDTCYLCFHDMHLHCIGTWLDNSHTHTHEHMHNVVNEQTGMRNRSTSSARLRRRTLASNTLHYTCKYTYARTSPLGVLSITLLEHTFPPLGTLHTKQAPRYRMRLLVEWLTISNHLEISLSIYI
jgi:hypothetical protein